jgi:hypothetical protein
VLEARTRGEWGRDECGEVGRAPHPFIGGQGGVETSGRGGDRSAAVVMAINDHPVQWGGEMEG